MLCLYLWSNFIKCYRFYQMLPWIFLHVALYYILVSSDLHFPAVSGHRCCQHFHPLSLILEKNFQNHWPLSSDCFPRMFRLTAWNLFSIFCWSFWGLSCINTFCLLLGCHIYQLYHQLIWFSINDIFSGISFCVAIAVIVSA